MILGGLVLSTALDECGLLKRIAYGVCKAMGLKPGKEAALLCFAGAVGSNGSVIMLYHPGFVSLLGVV